jgi:D-glycero-D-manno-heptose 1,7-bisphosphate phosphatase
MRAIFLDRDGVINENRTDHVKSWSEFQFLPGALTALRWLNLVGFHVFVVTNQAIVGRGSVSAATIEEINSRMQIQVALHGGRIHDVRYCPHDNDAQCGCRKPAPGMLLDLAARWGVDLSRSYMVGDAYTDIAAGRAAQCRCIMVCTGRGMQQISLPEARHYPPDYVAGDLTGAVAWICRQEQLTLPRPEVAPPWRRAGAGALAMPALLATERRSIHDYVD